MTGELVEVFAFEIVNVEKGWHQEPNLCLRPGVAVKDCRSAGFRPKVERMISAQQT